jgi:hypothetical protein
MEMSKAIEDVITERKRQIEAEGWTPAHDDEHKDGAMAEAAAAYAIGRPFVHPPIHVRGSVNQYIRADLWPWDMAWWKPKSRRENLVRAGALIIAEIERLDRAAATPTED